MFEFLSALFAILFTIYAVKWHTRKPIRPKIVTDWRETRNPNPGDRVIICSVKYMRGSMLVKEQMIGKIIRPVYKGLVTVEVNIGGTFVYGSFPPDDLQFLGRHI